jgi:hypothetical protein
VSSHDLAVQRAEVERFRSPMRCAVHGDAVNCPAFCTSQLIGSEDPGTPGGPAADPGRNTLELSREGVSENRTASTTLDSGERDLSAVAGDIAKAREAVTRARRELDDLEATIQYARTSLDDCASLLSKYPA